MATFQATSNAKSAVKRSTFNSTKYNGYNRSAISSWQYANNEALDILNEYQEKIKRGDWLSTEDRAKYKTAIDSYTSSGNALREASRFYGTKYTADEEKSWQDSLSSLQSGYSSVNDFYNQFADSDVYAYWKKGEDYKSVLSDKDFASYVDAGKNVSNPGYYAAKERPEWIGWLLGEEEPINNMVTFAETNAIFAGLNDVGGDKSISNMAVWINKHMSDEEKSIYNYYIGKGDKKTADEYLNYLDLQSRAAKAEAELFNNTIFEPLYSFGAGVQGGVQGVENFVRGIFGQEGVAPGTVQIADSYLREDNEGVWQVVNDLSSSIGNMAPSLLVGSLTGGIGGALTMGVSSAGNAYSDMLKQGYDVNQARAYGLLVGASESVLSYALGGISKLGGKLTGKAFSKLVAGMDNAMARLAIQYGGKLASEAVEEATQTWLEPRLKSLATGEEYEAAEWEDIIYSGMLGALSAGALEGLPGAINTGIGIKNAKAQYGSNPQGLVTEALELNPDSKAAQRAQSRIDAGKKVSGADLYSMVSNNERAYINQDTSKIKSAVESRLTELGETGDVSAIADALTKQVKGEELTHKESKLLKESKVSERVANELNRENIRSGQYSSSWAEGIGTKRVNADVYNRRESSNTNSENARGETTPHPSSNDATFPSEQRGRQNVLAESGKLIEQAAKDKVGRIEGFTEDTASIMIKDYDGSVSPSEYIMAFDQAFMLGREDAQIKEVTRLSADSGVTGRALLHAYDAGLQSRNVASKATKSENTALQNTAEGGIINTESESITNEGKTDTESVYLRQGRERLAGANPEGQVSRVEGGAGQNQEWREGRGRPADSEVARLIDEGRGREVRVADLGILNGSKQQKVRVIDEQDYTPEIKEAVAEAKAQGLNAKVFVGDDILIEEKNGSISGVHAYVLGNQMLIRADHEYFTSKQFARHEMGHDKIAKGQVDIKAVRKRLEEKVGKEAIDSVAQTYAEAYRGTGLDADEVWEECICDSLGDMNIFAGDEIISDFMEPMIEEIKAAAENETKAPTQTRGSPEGKASRELKKGTVYEKETEVYVTRKETRDEFNRAAYEANCTVGERGKIAYAYKVCRSVTENAQKTKEELGKLGIKGIIHEGLKSNFNGTTTIYDAGASTFVGVCVFVDNETGRNPIEVAGHEAFHYWRGSALRKDLVDIITDNIDFSSREFIAFESKIEKDYFNKEVEIDDDSWDGLNEEIYAYIVGHVYAGDIDNDVRPFLRDYDEVKTATDSFFASQQGEGKASRELDLIDYINERAEREAVTDKEVKKRVSLEKEMSNRELLASALESITSYPSERGILTDYRAMLETIGKAERRIADIDSDIKALSKDKKNAEYVKLLQKEKASLTEEIHLADKRLLKLESAKALKKVMEREKARVAEQGKKDLARLRERSEARLAETKKQYQESRARATEGRHKTAERHKIKALKDKFISTLEHPTERQYVPADLVSAMVEVCKLVDTDAPLYKADGSINKAQQARNEQMQRLFKLSDEYKALKNNPDPMYSGEYDEEIQEYLDDLRREFSGKHISEMTLGELNELYTTMRAIEETLRDARRLIGWGEADLVYDAGDKIIAGQKDITVKRKGKGENSTKARFIDLSLSPLRNVKRMANYEKDSPLVKMFRELELGVRHKNKFVMEAHKSFEELTSGSNAKKYEDAIYKPYGKEYVDKEGRKFHVSKMQMMQAIMSYNRELENDKLHHVSDGGFTFADLDMLNKGKLGEAIDPKNAHSITIGAMLAEQFRAELAKDKWAQDYMVASEYFFDVMAKNAINNTNMVLKHRLVATGKKYIPYEVNKDFVVREITSENDIQQTISGYGMLKDIKAGATQPLIITGLNNVLERHIEQVGNIYGLAVPIRNFNKVWNVKASDGSTTVQEMIGRNWGSTGKSVMTQAVKDVQGARIDRQSDHYKKVKGNVISSTFMLNGSVVAKQIGSMFSATSMLRWRDPARMIANLVYTMANHKKIAAEVDKYTATAWMRRQGLSDAELYTLTTEARKKGLSRLVSKLPTAINPTKWIAGMDSMVALSLWKYAKQDVAKRTGLKGEALLEATAEFYDDVIENTQSMTDALHRPEIQKRKDILSDMLGVFKTDLYQGAGQLQNALGECKADPSKENKAALARTIYANVMSACWGSLMTTVFALLRYKVNRYRDDEDDEIDAESWLNVQGADLAADLVSYALPLFGGEIAGSFFAIMNGETPDSADNLTLTAVQDLIDAITAVANSAKDGEMPTEAAFNKILTKAGSVLGLPVNNVTRLIEAIRLHAEDFANGELLSFEAGLTKPNATRLYNAYIEGDAEKIEKASRLYADQKAIDTALRKALRDNDPRLEEAALAMLEGDDGTYWDLFLDVVEEGKFEPELIKAAFEAEYNYHKGKKKEAEERGKEYP